jgi:hypothetical protein
MSKSINVTLNIDDTLKFDNDNSVCVNISQRAGNTLTIENDGLYSQAIPGEPGSTGTGFPDGYRSTETGVKSGEASPESTTSTPRRLVAPKILHRIYTSNDIDGSDLIDKRSVDILYPGDFYRVHDDSNALWKYFIIVKTDGSNVITPSSLIAEIPDSYENIN